MAVTTKKFHQISTFKEFIVLQTYLVIHDVDFNHLRLLDLTKLADQAEPFYKWVERKFQIHTHCGNSLDLIIKKSTKDEIKSAILSCYYDKNISEIPKLFDGGGIPYKHKKACFFFFSWLARDAATQRLTPLIANVMRSQHHSLIRVEMEAEILSRLLFIYKDNVKFFDWCVFREIALNRLEGSRRAKKGSELESYVRTALTEAFSYYFKTRGNYGKYIDFEILDKPLKVNNRTYDVVASLRGFDKQERLLIMPVKTRETQGGGHAHLFSRDIEQANKDVLISYPTACIASVIIAQNWSQDEINIHSANYDGIFYFNQNPNSFSGFDELNQRRLNFLVERVLDDAI